MKAPSYINGIDFAALSSREFEEVIYMYFQEQIKSGLYQEVYDKAELYSGVGERGCDIGLYFNGKIYGCVQCKNYKKNISFKVIFEDIIKLALHHVVECKANNTNSSTLIADINNFTYYACASTGFTSKAIPLLQDFSNQWKNQNVGAIFDDLIFKYRSFNGLIYNEIREDLHNVLSRIKVNTIIGIDIKNVIKLNHEIVRLYFNPGITQHIEEDIKEIKHAVISGQLSKDELNKKAGKISNEIRKVKTHFGTAKGPTIERKEVNTIFQWIKEPFKTKDSNLLVLSGNAGMGKSVVVSQLYSKLVDNEIPVLCLKADRLAFESIKDLKSELDLNIDIGDFLNQLIGEGDLGVLLIDQIDALSLSLSSNLKPLNTYDNIIRDFIENYPKVKIVISSRTYDLNYDPILTAYKEKNKVALKPLENEELKVVVQHNIGVELNQFSGEILKLLSVPLHLDVFLKIYSKELDLKKLSSIQDLYDELWRQKILNKTSGFGTEIRHDKVVSLLFSIGQKMYEQQQINVAERSFEDDFPKEIQYLKSEGILVGNKRIEFFHQSFFDYCFARSFVHRGLNLVEDIQSRHQGLFIRSKVQQILTFIRNEDPQKHVNLIESLIESKKIRFHIKLLVLQQLAFEDRPSAQEVSLIERLLSQSLDIKEIFLSLYLGKGWLKVIIEKRLIEDEIKNRYDEKSEWIRTLFRGFINRGNDDLLDYFISLKHMPNMKDLILDLLWGIKTYESKKCIELADFILSEFKGEEKEFYLGYFVENAIPNYTGWATKWTLKLVDISSSRTAGAKEFYFPFSKRHSVFYSKFWKEKPREAYLLVKAIIIEITVKRKLESKLPEQKLKSDYGFWLYNRKEYDLYFHYKQLNKVQSYLEDEFLHDEKFVRSEVRAFLNSESVTLIMIALSVINHHPESFLQESSEIFESLTFLKECYGHNLYLDYLLQSILKNSYQLLERPGEVDKVILNFYPKSELRIVDYGNGRTVKSKSFGYSKLQLLSSIPRSLVSNNKILKKDFDELRRKFGKDIVVAELEEPKVTWNDDVLSSSAYENMKFEDWKNSFRKYSNNAEWSHGRRFEQEVANNPDKLFPLVKELLTDDTINNAYKIKGLEGLTKSKFQVTQVLELFNVLINSAEFDDFEQLSLVWVSRYFSDNEIVNVEVLEFLKDIAINGSEVSSVEGDDDLTAGVNSARGAAVSGLMDYSFSDDVKPFVLDILETLVESSSAPTRACAVFKLQNFIKDNEKRTLKLCLRLVDDCSPGVVKVAQYPLQYLVNYDFAAIIPFLEKAMLQENNKATVGMLITKAYCFEYNGAERLIELFSDLGTKQVNEVVKTAFRFLNDVSVIKKPNKLALKLVGEYVNIDDKDLGETYGRAFYHFKISIFPDLYSFIKKYRCSKIGKFRDDAFYEYLKKCSRDFPEKCIELTKGFENQINESYRHRMYRNAPLNVIVQSYNSIRDYNSNSASLEEAINVFDKLLEHSEYRSGAFEVLRDLDEY